MERNTQDDSIGSQDVGDESVTNEFTHDRFFYAMWSNTTIAKPFFRRFLPAELLKSIDLETLRPTPTRIVNDKGKESEGDVFYLVDTIDDRKMVLNILLEHKSGPAPYVSLQTLRYVVERLEVMTKSPEIFKNVDGRFPMPFTVVLSQYDAPQLENIVDFVHGTEEYGPHFRFHQVNIQKEPFDDLRDQAPFLYISMALARLAYLVGEDETDEELLKIFGTIFQLDPADKKNISTFCNAFLRYAAWFMRKTSFNLGQFKVKLSELEDRVTGGKDNMVKSFFCELFADELPEELREKIRRIEELETSCKDKDEALAVKDKALADKDAVIADKDAMLADNELQLTNSKVSLNDWGLRARKAIIARLEKRFHFVPESILRLLDEKDYLGEIFDLTESDDYNSLEEFERFVLEILRK